MVDYPIYRVSGAHVAPVFLNLEKTVDKVCSLIREAASNGAQPLAFPESYVPAFPVWCALKAPIHNHDLFQLLASNSMLVDGLQMKRVRKAARRSGIFVSLGFNEASDVSLGTLWNSNVLIGDDGAILNHHRKMVPTFYEKLVWGNGDGAGLRISKTRLGHIGMLICGENTNPLARFSLIAQGEQLHISSYPPVWPTRDPSLGQNYDLAEAIRIRAGAHSFEAKAFNLVVSGFMDKTMHASLSVLDPEAGRILDGCARGISMLLGPTGVPVSETMIDEEGLLYGEIDMSACLEPKQFHDVAGHYNRFDIFNLTVNRSANRPVSFWDRDQSPVSGSEGDEGGT